MCLLDDTIDLGQLESVFFTQGFGLGSAQLSKEMFGTR